MRLVLFAAIPATQWLMTLVSGSPTLESKDRSLLSKVPLASQLGGVHLLLKSQAQTHPIKKNAFLLLSNSTSYSHGMKACESLSEKVYRYVPGSSGALELVELLRTNPVANTEVQGHDLFWVHTALFKPDQCQAVDKRTGNLEQTPCQTRLPTVCYNSAERYIYPQGTKLRRIQIDSPIGPVIGWRDQNAFRFLGIPYAEPPVGERRWAKPVPKRYDHQVLEAIDFGYVCPQTPAGWLPRLSARLQNGAYDSEDCLHLNVYTPSLKTAGVAGLAVLVYLHGSMFTHYASSMPLFDPGHLVARGGVVVVSLNYRLGFLGFLENVEAWGREPTVVPGNQAMHDQILALQWIHDNIAAFGGDPNRVTLMGVSSGATSIRALLAAKAAWPYYHRAIAQSDPITFPFKPASLAAREARVFLGCLGCAAHDLACARSKSMAEVLEAQRNATGHLLANYHHARQGDTAEQEHGWWTALGVVHRHTVDGEDIPADFATLVQEGRYNTQAALLWGTTSDEAGYFTDLFWPDPIPFEDAQAALAQYMPADRAAAALRAMDRFFPLDRRDPDTFRKAATWQATRVIWFCPLRYLSRQMTTVSQPSQQQQQQKQQQKQQQQQQQQQQQPIYVYRFHYGRDFPVIRHKFCAVSKGRVCHASDVQPGLGSGDALIGQTQDGDDARYARQVIDRFTSFAKAGNPNPARRSTGPSLPDPTSRSSLGAAAPGWEASNPDVAGIEWWPYNATHENLLEVRLDGTAMSVQAESDVCDWMDRELQYAFQTDGRDSAQVKKK